MSAAGDEGARYKVVRLLDKLLPRAATAHGLSIHGDLKYGPGFQHFAYADPRAPRSGV